MQHPDIRSHKQMSEGRDYSLMMTLCLDTLDQNCKSTQMGGDKEISKTIVSDGVTSWRYGRDYSDDVETSS